MAMTYHLTLRERWESQRTGTEYTPEPFELEGFIHCTNGDANVIDVGNRYYVNDDREMVCLVIDADAVLAEIRYEDPNRIFPHIYGPLNIDAVREVRSVERERDGTFTRLGDPLAR